MAAPAPEALEDNRAGRARGVPTAGALLYLAIAVAAALYLDSEEELSGAPLLAVVVSSVALGAVVGRAWTVLVPGAGLIVVAAVAFTRYSGHDLADSLLGSAGLAAVEAVLVGAGLGLRAVAR